MRFAPTSARHREGVALVLVLGILSVMTILAVAFAISMRVERLSSASNSDLTRAWGLADVGLARAMEYIDGNVGAGDVKPPWVVRSSTAGAGPAYPDIVVGTAQDYLLDPIVAHAEYVAASANLKWQDVNFGGRNGRYAFLIADCSGYLDLNYVGGLARGAGVQPGEIRHWWGEYDQLELRTNGVAHVLDGRANTWKRFECLPDLHWAIGASAWWPINATYVRNFFPYSYFPPGFLDNPDAAQPVARDAIDLTAGLPAVGELQTAFTEAGFADANNLALNLLDYMDPDNEPRSLDSICTERVPMINEVAISNILTTIVSTNGITYSNIVSFAVEVWYPFGEANPNDYTVEARLVSIGSSQPLFNPALPVTRIPLSQPWPGANRFRVVSYTAPAVYTDSSASGVTPGLPTELLMQLTVREGNNLPAGVLVDRLQIRAPWNSFGFPTSVPTNSTTVTSGVSRQADDPRINWDWAAAAQWRNAATPSLGGMNAAVSTNAAGADGHWLMHVANKAPQSIGELGFLLYNGTKPWRTIRLMGPDPDKTTAALDRFVASTQTKGFVSLNSIQQVVLGAVLMGAGRERVPGETGAISSNTALQATTLAQQIINARLTGTPPAYQNFSDLSLLNEANVRAALGGVGATDAMQAEAVMRNTIGLLRVRQSIYTILFAGQALAPDNTTVLAEQKGVAVVWRDPYPDAQGKHPSFIRFFRWLQD